MKEIKNWTVLGAGAFGTALALVLAKAGRNVRLWGRDARKLEGLKLSGENPRLEGIELPEKLEITSDAGTFGRSEAFILAVPAQFQREALGELRHHLAPDALLINAAKGLELESGKLLAEVVSDVMPQARQAFLSGPSFAREIARGLPTALTLACTEPGLGEAIQQSFAGSRLRLYLSRDVVGVELAGAYKNVLAIGAGISEGAELGQSARAALMTRGLHEMGRLIQALGGERETILGLAGLGDLMLTAHSPMSRNYSLGLALGRGLPLEQALAQSKGVVEGVPTAKALCKLSNEKSVDLPIAEAIHALLYEGASITALMQRLLSRDLGWEH